MDRLISPLKEVITTNPCPRQTCLIISNCIKYIELNQVDGDILGKLLDVCGQIYQKHNSQLVRYLTEKLVSKVFKNCIDAKVHQKHFGWVFGEPFIESSSLHPLLLKIVVEKVKRDNELKLSNDTACIVYLAKIVSIFTKFLETRRPLNDEMHQNMYLTLRLHNHLRLRYSKELEAYDILKVFSNFYHSSLYWLQNLAQHRNEFDHFDWKAFSRIWKVISTTHTNLQSNHVKEFSQCMTRTVLKSVSNMYFCESCLCGTGKLLVSSDTIVSGNEIVVEKHVGRSLMLSLMNAIIIGFDVYSNVNGMLSLYINFIF